MLLEKRLEQNFLIRFEHFRSSWEHRSLNGIELQNSLHGHVINSQGQSLCQACFQEYLFRKILEDFQEDLIKQRFSITGVSEKIFQVF